MEGWGSVMVVVAGCELHFPMRPFCWVSALDICVDYAGVATYKLKYWGSELASTSSCTELDMGLKSGIPALGRTALLHLSGHEMLWRSLAHPAPFRPHFAVNS